MSYKQFSNLVSKQNSFYDALVKKNGEADPLRKTLLIIDEAHNLRDVPGETADDNLDSAGGDEEVGDAAAGKRLTPSLTDLLRVVYGMKLVLLTATPMYNNYKEIIFILNLLLRNDKRLSAKRQERFSKLTATHKKSRYVEAAL
jgi:N12 class adenine-specific DNA methylase